MLCGVVGTPTLALNCAIPVYRNHGAMRVAAHSVRRPAAVVAPYQDLMGLSVKMEVGPVGLLMINSAALQGAIFRDERDERDSCAWLCGVRARASLTL